MILFLPVVLTIDPKVEDYSTFLRDYILASASPVIITAYLCWEKGILLKNLIYLYIKVLNKLYFDYQFRWTDLCTPESSFHDDAYTIYLSETYAEDRFSRTKAAWSLCFECFLPE